ncbi:MAG: septal ring lytic transglycosylase RlpA family protein [Chitinophagaceae bacterium]|nr:septal ring lytic transglycosylase RlpA family protein [Polaromonas sp.]
MSADLQGTALILPMDPEPASFEIFSNPSRPSQLAGLPARELERGGASWYGPGFQGRLTASGERYNMNAMTAAHRTLPFGTWVRVHSLVNGREVEVRITDRGPFIRNRVIDLSRAAATALGMLQLGFKEVVLLLPETAAPAELANGTVVKVQPRPKSKPVKRQQPKITD